jgi:hypothetical protein
MKSVLNKVQMGVMAVILIASLGAVQVNRMLNMHYHLDDYGRLVTHYHPYDKADDKGPLKTHGHGKCDLTTPVGSIDLSVFSIQPLFIQAPEETIIYYSFSIPINGEEGIHLFRGRAPPSITI